MEKQFKIGDVVELKSGGPLMTIVDHQKTTPMQGPGCFNGNVGCRWFSSNEIRYDIFPEESLELKKISKN